VKRKNYTRYWRRSRWTEDFYKEKR